MATDSDDTAYVVSFSASADDTNEVHAAAPAAAAGLTRDPANQYSEYVSAKVERNEASLTVASFTNNSCALRVGACVGIGVGIPTTNVGDSVVGAGEGARLGRALGACVGFGEGAGLGSDVGWADGTAVGSGLGMAVGTAVGTGLGSAVGWNVGLADGFAVGALVGAANLLLTCMLGAEYGVETEIL